MTGMEMDKDFWTSSETQRPVKTGKLCFTPPRSYLPVRIVYDARPDGPFVRIECCGMLLAEIDAQHDGSGAVWCERCGKSYPFGHR